MRVLAEINHPHSLREPSGGPGALLSARPPEGSLGLMLPFSLALALVDIESGGLGEHAGKMCRHVCRQKPLAVETSKFTCH